MKCHVCKSPAAWGYASPFETRWYCSVCAPLGLYWRTWGWIWERLRA